MLVLVLASLVSANNGEEDGVSGPNPHGYYTYGRYYGYGWPRYNYWYGRRKRSTAEEAVPAVPADESVPGEEEGGPSPHGYGYPYRYYYGYGYPYYSHWYGRRKRSVEGEGEEAVSGPNPTADADPHYGYYYGHGWPYYSR